MRTHLIMECVWQAYMIQEINYQFCHLLSPFILYSVPSFSPHFIFFLIYMYMIHSLYYLLSSLPPSWLPLSLPGSLPPSSVPSLLCPILPPLSLPSSVPSSLLCPFLPWLLCFFLAPSVPPSHLSTPLGMCTLWYFSYSSCLSHCVGTSTFNLCCSISSHYCIMW